MRLGGRSGERVGSVPGGGLRPRAAEEVESGAGEHAGLEVVGTIVCGPKGCIGGQ